MTEPIYVFKPWHELAWGAAIAIGFYILGELVLFDPEAVSDWREWAIVLFGGSIRAAAGALLALVRR